MAKTLAQLTAKTVELPIVVDDDPEAFTVWYRPHNMTASIEQKALEWQKNGAELEALVETFIPVVAKWDLRMTEDSEIVPLTREAVAEVPSSILMLILEQVGQHRNPDPKGI